MNRLIRYRLVTIVLLGVLTSALSVFALVQLLTTSTAQRIERAHDAVTEEVDRLARSPAQLSEPTPTALVAMRAGVWTSDEAHAPSAIPPAFVDPIRSAVAEARREQKRVTLEIGVAEGRMVVGAKPVANPSVENLPPGSVVFAAYVVRPMQSLRTWQRIITSLAALTILLIAIAVYSVIAANRGANALRASLEALATDLRAPVARPSLRELDAIADGIAELARKLEEARVKEEQLAQKLAHEGRLAALGRVAAGVAHEVRNPLASIKLRLDLAVAATSSPLPDSAAKAIAHATSEIERLDRLVADLLVVAGRAIGPKASVDLGALVRERVDGLAPWATERGVALVTSGHATALVDRDATSRAIDNLLRNAVEASSRGQTVRAIVTEESAKSLVRIEDEGSGVLQARTSELFEPFFTTKPAGTGLGLALSRAIAQAHGGDVVYERIADKTRFTLTLEAATTTKRAA